MKKGLESRIPDSAVPLMSIIPLLIVAGVSVYAILNQKMCDQYNAGIRKEPGYFCDENTRVNKSNRRLNSQY